jgi:hypothetical protein
MNVILRVEHLAKDVEAVELVEDVESYKEGLGIGGDANCRYF